MKRINLTFGQACSIVKAISGTAETPLLVRGERQDRKWFIEETELEGIIMLSDNEFQEGENILIDANGNLFAL